MTTARARMDRAWNRVVGAAAGLAVSSSAVIALSWARSRGLGGRPDPASDYHGALERLARLEALDDDPANADLVNPLCRTRALLHGRRTAKVLVLEHGLTNCPQQFAPLGQRFFERGYNVLLARMPRHGFANRMTRDLEHLRAEELRDHADRVVDVASGLGERVIVAGLSAGGVVAAWAAQHRPEVARAVLIAPFVGLAPLAGRTRLGRRLQLLIMNLLTFFPDLATQAFAPFGDAAPYAYLGFSTRSLGEVERLAAATFFSALLRRPACQDLLLVTNAADEAVSNGVARYLVMAWQSRGVRRAEYYEFDRELGLHHDLIDPNNPIQRVDLVYPILLDLIDHE